MKKIVTLIFTLLVVFLLTVPAMAETGSIQITLETEAAEVYQGDTLELTLTATADAACDSYGYYLELDPAVFAVLDYELQDTNRIQFSTFDHQGLAVAYGVAGTPKDAVCRVTLQVLEDAPLGEVSLEGKPAARLETEALNAAGSGQTLQVLCHHSYEAWHQTNADTHTGTCTRCGHVEVTAHNWDAGAVTVAPTCTEGGTLVHVCTDCAQVLVVQVQPQHSYDNDCDAECNLCGAARTITHRYEEAWQFDEDGHYQSCVVCGSIPFKKAHTPSSTKATEEEAVVCTECSYIITPVIGHVHNYADAFSMDAAGHWHDCDGCMEKGEPEAHSFENSCDAVCDTCGYTRQVSHQTSQFWTSDEESHYRVCNLCGEKLDVLQHAPGEKATEFTPRLCLVCDRELSAALGHNMSESWYFDEEAHYHQCDCGEKADVAAHIWSDHGEDGYVTCTVCGAKTEAVHMGVWIALGAALLAAAGCVVAVVIRRKKKVTAE